MAYYFAKVSSNSTVDLVVKIGSQNCTNYFGEVSEVVGAEHCAATYGAGPGERWIRTTKDSTIRGKYAGMGDEYDEENDRFLPPRPHGAWTFNSTSYQYEPPIPRPDLTDEERDAGKYYSWDDNSYIEDNTTGWILEGGN
jgi:hypothetical protein